MIADKIIDNKNKIQNFLDSLNCDDDKWFVFNCSTGDNPTLRKFSHRMSYRIMNSNTETFKCRFLYLKIKKDMIVSCDNYESIKVDDMDIENEKYNDIGDSYLRKDLFGELGDLFSDDKIYTVHYIEALGGVDPHRDPWIYNKDYKNKTSKSVINLQVGELNRQYELFTPKLSDNESLPILFAFHGGGGRDYPCLLYTSPSPRDSR